MAVRPTWKGYLSVSVVSLPVRAYSATSSIGSPLPLNQLLEACERRIRYQKTCPIHGEVTHHEATARIGGVHDNWQADPICDYVT